LFWYHWFVDKHELAPIVPDDGGKFEGALNIEKALTLRLQDSAERTKLEARINDPATSIRDLAALQRGLWRFVLGFDTDTSMWQTMRGTPFDGMTKETLGAGLLALFASYLAHILLPVGIKDPYKRHEQNELTWQERGELRAELARVHAVVSQKLVERQYWSDTYRTLPEPPKRRRR
jgi:hypothetical protein